MRMTKMGATLASLAITTAGAALLAGTPAHAADSELAVTPAPTTARLAINQQTAVKALYGNPIGYLEPAVADENGGLVYTGSAVLQRRLPGRTWTDVRTDGDTSDGISFGSYGHTATSNVRYRFHYLGGTDPNTSITYAPSVSNVVTVTTYWNFKDTSACPNGRCHISGRLIPRTAGHKIVIQVKHGSWQRYRILHTSSRGTYRVGVTGSPAGTKYRMIITATKRLTATQKRYTVIRVSGRTTARAISPR